MAQIIDFLLGNTRDAWTRGDFSFQSHLGGVYIIAGLALLILIVLLLYRRTTARTALWPKAVLVLLKTTALGILFFCLLQPVLTTSSTRPRESYVGLLIDNSRSMTIRDMDRSRSRAAFATDLLYGDNGLVEQLHKNFKLVQFGFDRQVYPISDPGDLSFTGTSTHVAKGMRHVTEAMKGLPLEALVLITDGADNSIEDPLFMAGLLRASHIPVYVIGIGAEKPVNDLEINAISTSGSVMEDGIFEVQVTVLNRGYAGSESELLIQKGERVFAAQKIKLGPAGVAQRHTLYLTPEEEGTIVYTARIAEQEDEIITENNRLAFLVDNQKKRVEILYIEGHPRNEYKFIRRAAETDAAVRLKTYLMTGPQKFLRQNIDSPMELAQGFPANEAALFKYDGVIFGDVPRNFFTDDQLELTRAFVSRRGGGFLMLGGSTGFEIGFIGTPVEDLLPVTLVPENHLPSELRGGGRGGDHPTGRAFPLQLTTEGWRSMLLRLGVDEEANRNLWRDMPQLQGINVAGREKPGATVLAVHPTLRFQGRPLPVIAHERYGRGRTMAIMTATTWRWQMLKPHADTSHERFWRQVLRWLTADTPAPTQILLEHNHFGTGDDVSVRALVYDRSYEPITGATVWLKITDPDGSIHDLQMQADISRGGDYIAEFAAAKPGVYQLEVSSSGGLEQKSYASSRFFVTDSFHETRNLALNNDLLAKMAQAGGGKYYTPMSADMLVRDLESARQTQTVTTQLDVWDIPMVFFLLLAFLGLEWLLRRRRGLS